MSAPNQPANVQGFKTPTSFYYGGGDGVNTGTYPTTIVAAGTNVNGIMIVSGEICSCTYSGGGAYTIHAIRQVNPQYVPAGVALTIQNSGGGNLNLDRGLQLLAGANALEVTNVTSGGTATGTGAFARLNYKIL